MDSNELIKLANKLLSPGWVEDVDRVADGVIALAERLERAEAILTRLANYDYRGGHCEPVREPDKPSAAELARAYFEEREGR